MTRIAYLLTQDRGGPVDVTVRLAATLADDGHDVRVFGPVPARGAALLDGHHEELAVTGKEDLAAAGRARAALRAWRPDVVHAQDRRAGLVIAGLRFARGARPALVQTYHGVPDDVAEPWFRGARGAAGPSAYTRTVLAADAVVARVLDRTIVPAEAMGAFLRRRLRVPAGRLVHVDNCVSAASPSPPQGPVRHLVFAGLLVERKGALDLLAALSLPGVLPPDARLTVIGDGPERAAAERAARQPPLAGRVTFLGFRPDVPALLAGADALVLPSTMEQQPLVVAEAMAAGKPVLATATGGVPAMLDVPGTPAFLAPPGDVPALADRLRALFAEPDPGRLGRLLAERAHARYRPEACARRHLDLYDQLTRSCRPANHG
ncbi:glycosyl transferase [Amycolatopsis mediterranei S699]|uniref:Glycosyltransferase n=3 Tax=Amycolatopsis mediterranei TaxID=33910 RepID=A0A0H3DHH8_AMYMU|nr:glycosyltransferase family 4 protein [Amycolatopsis mediterranei]ADJ49114.1 glycosyltransferase [Amycolatopsis mediterranei U32]AEK46075.1 glycosyl transferase [Amycolatopsis mediterranei S699]AFO80822.1 glycosyl transferase [Amycolatopsis mediterranei S699]AGT87950.1 glycosyl transferase [Amycolatopsis mediterranei RB]KDO04095.1 glycosyl transferase [Amycolatopsis mediterranei]